MFVTLATGETVNSDLVLSVYQQGTAVMVLLTDGRVLPVAYTTEATAAVGLENLIVLLNSATSGVPSITQIFPSQVGTAGGDSVVIVGLNFQNGAVLDVGGTNLSETWLDGQTFYCITPAKGAGVYDVTYTGPDSQVAVKTGGLEYI